ncbi:MAG: VWA domain-containing protein [Acidobacteriota bacterium]
MWRVPTLPVLLALPVLALGGAGQGEAVPASPDDAEGPRISIVEPRAGRPVAGEVRLRAEVTHAAAPVRRVVFRVDGERVAAPESPPWKAVWNAGLEYEAHLLEVTAVDADGRSTTASRKIPPILLREYVAVLDSPMEEIRLSVTVTDGEGETIQGLQRSDFLVTENGRPQELSDFGREGDRDDRPLSILILVDRSSSMRVHLPGLRAAVEALLDALRPQDEVAVATVLRGDFEIVQEFVSAGDPLDPALAEMGSAGGSTPLFDAIDQALGEMRDRPGRRVILALTDGWDDQLRLNVNFFQNNYLLDLARRAQRSGTQITLIWPGPPSQGRLAIENLVEETGGLIYYTSGDMPGLLRRIARQLQDQYYLAYYSDDPARDGRRRKIDVQVVRPGIKTWTIGGFFALPPQIAVLRSEIRDEDPEVRAEAARALGYLEDDQAVKLLRSALKDDDPEVRAHAARGLGLRQDRKAIPALVKVLDDDSPAARTAAFDALVGIGQPATRELLARLPRTEGATTVLYAMLLGEVGDDRALEPLAELLGSSRPEERLAAADALGELGLSGGLRPLERTLEDPDRRVRLKAITAVARIGGSGAVAVLERYGGREPDPELRHVAADALANVLATIRGR